MYELRTIFLWGGTKKKKGKGGYVIRSSSASAPSVTDLEVIEFGLELLDGAVGHFEVLVETVTFRNKLRID